jgi:hypothetical protein
MIAHSSPWNPFTRFHQEGMIPGDFVLFATALSYKIRVYRLRRRGRLL